MATKGQTMKQLVRAALFAAGVAAATPSLALTRADQIGEPGSPAMADRTLQVTPGTHYLNVHPGETVNLDIGGRGVPWKFDGLARVVRLQDIAPGAPEVNVYVTEVSTEY
jgi:hypothetical protein